MSDQGIENPNKKLGNAKSQLLRGLRDKERKDRKKGVMSRMPVMKKKPSKNKVVRLKTGGFLSTGDATTLHTARR